MKKLILILVLTLSLQSWTKADDIRDFEIEGMSIGDSLLDYMSEKEILNQIELNKDVHYYLSDKFTQVYKYDGTIEFKKNECNSVRKLIQIEARILKDIFYHAENMFNHLKEFNLEAVKYKKLYKLKIEQNFYHKELLELKDKLKTIRDEWDRLNETSYVGSSIRND